MKRRFLGLGLAIAMLATTGLRAVADESPRDLDLRRAIPADAFMAVYGKHNPSAIISATITSRSGRRSKRLRSSSGS